MAKKTTTEDLADRLHSTAIHLLRLVRVEDAATGIGPARLSALSVIVFGGPVSLNDLARAEQVRPPTMSDRRAVVIEATEKGAQILKQGRKRRVKFLASYLRRLSAAERKEIDRAVTAIQKAMQRG